MSTRTTWTFRQWAHAYLVSRGMFDKQADAVLESLALAPDPMQGRWNDCIDDYPDVVLNAVSLSLDAHAVKWIEENLPNAWFKPMFQH